MIVMNRCAGFRTWNRVGWMLLGVFCYTLLGAESASGQPCSCDNYLPPGLSAAQTYKIEDGAAPNFFTGFQGGGTTDVGHANLFTFAPGTTINYVCIGLRDHNPSVSPQAAVRVRVPGATGDPGGVIHQTNFTVNPVANHQIVQLNSVLTLSGQIWFEVVYFAAEPGWSHQGTRPSNTSKTMIRLGNGAWIDYDAPNVFPGKRAVIRPQYLVPFTCDIRIEDLSASQTTEAGGSVTFKLRLLGTPPTSNVTVSFGSSDPSEGICSVNQLVFTPQDWSFPRIVTVTGQDDSFLDGDIAYTVDFANSSSGDPCWDDLSIPSIPLTNLDDESPCQITVGSLSSATTSELGTTLTFWVTLEGPAPSSNVMLNLGTSDASEGIPSPAQLVFTPANWAAGQIVTVTGQDDALVDGNVSYSIWFGASSSTDSCWSGLSVPSVQLTNVDDEYADPCAPRQVDKLIDVDGAQNDQFGSAVALSDRWAVIGNRGDSGVAGVGGSVSVFERIGTSWILRQQLFSADIAVMDRFGESLALSGNRLIVGAPESDDLGLSSGSVYVFDYNGSTWVETAKLLAQDGGWAERFGGSVALLGNRLVVGAWLHDVAGVQVGAAYVFEFDGVSWAQTDKLLPSVTNLQIGFGRQVELSATSIFVAAPFAHQSAGCVYVFERSGSSWIETPILAASDGSLGSYFGWSFSLSEDQMLIGAPQENGMFFNSGAAYLFLFNGTNWSETAKLKATDAAQSAKFGTSVSIHGNRVLVGALKDGERGMVAGAAYLFAFDGTSWSEQEKIIPAETQDSDFFGSRLVLHEDLALITADRGDGVLPNIGAVYVYDLMVGLGNYGVGLAGTGGEVPRLRAEGCAIMGNSVTIEIDNGLGSASGFLMLGFGRASVPLRGGTLLVQLPVNNIGIQLGGAPGLPGGGSLTLPLAIPNNPALIGLPINFQVALFDSGAIVGVSLSNGLEVIVDQ